jgi:hypothetical protein
MPCLPMSATLVEGIKYTSIVKYETSNYEKRLKEIYILYSIYRLINYTLIYVLHCIGEMALATLVEIHLLYEGWWEKKGKLIFLLPRPAAISYID